MSIEATEYIYMPAGAVPMIVASDGAGSWDIVHVTISGVDTDSGIRFLEWLRDKIRADQDAAKAFANVGQYMTRSEAVREFGVPIITEGDAAPSAAVHDIKPTPRGAP